MCSVTRSKHLFHEEGLFVYPMTFVRKLNPDSDSLYVLSVESERKLKMLMESNRFNLPPAVLEKCNRIAKFAFPKKVSSEKWIPRELSDGSLKTVYDGMAFTDTVLDDVSYGMAHPFEPFIIVKI